MVKGLRQGGLLVGDWLAKVSRWSSSTVKFDVKVIGAEGVVDHTTITPLEVSAFLRQELRKCRTAHRHVVALDGLDTFFFEAEDEWTSLAGLMQALQAVNREMVTYGTPVSVVAAVRSDIFDMLPGPEMNKLKPHAVHLDWHAYGIGGDNHLWKLLTKKAAVERPKVTNLVAQYLNTTVSIGPHRELTTFLLDNTRLLPRDVVALMSYLQREYKGSRSVPEENARRAVQLYAEEYFIGEVFDNLAGVLPAGKARGLAAFKDALRTTPSRFFTFQFMCEELAGDLEPNEIKALLRQMFETGGIGVRNGQNTDFVYRKVSGAGFTVRYQFVLQDALTRAWNRPWY
ncbi:hypothetical protein ASF47_04120 [Nocardioides sp. Leaf285]|nr:hypothetical protein ASF47_04120 [Nocardioides sp. Leaf285]